MKNYELLEKSKIKTTINYLHEVSKVTIDSRKVKEGAVYLCEDLQYLEEAILKGAKTIIIENLSALGGIATMGLVNIPLDFLSSGGKEFFEEIGRVGKCK